MKYSGYYKNDATAQGNPISSTHFYNYLTGLWKDSTQWSFSYVFPGSPCDSPQLSMVYPVQLPFQDYRAIQSFGAMTLAPNECKDMTIAVITTFNSVYPNPCFDNIQISIDSVKLLHNSLTTSVLSCHNNTLGVVNIESDKSLRLFPNPINGELIIESIEVKMKLLVIQNLLGETILQQPIMQKTNKLNLDVSQLPSGIYFIRAELVDGKIVSGKVVKIKP